MEAAVKYSVEEGDSLIIEISNNANRKGSFRFALSVSLFFSIIIITVPIIVFIILLTMGNGIPFGFIITCIAAALVSYYLFKIYLWNKYGKEVFIIRENQLTQFTDYKYFKENYSEINYKKMNIYIAIDNILMDTSEISEGARFQETESLLYLEVDKKIINSIIKIPIKDIISIAKQYYRTDNAPDLVIE